MKKMLSILTALALGSTGAVSVVACGTQEDTTLSWGLEEYQDKENLKIWVAKDNLENLDKLELTKLFWTGIFDADDKDGNHERQWKRFTEQEVDKHLDIVDSENIINKIKSAKDDFSISGVEIKLDQDLKSKTDQDNPTDYILKASEVTLSSLTVVFI